MKRLMLAVCLWSATALAATPEDKAALEKAFGLYQTGAYAQSAAALEKISPSDRETQATVAYFKGLNHAKLQEFSKAAKSFREAISLGEKAKEIHYELGQVLYADQMLDEASSEFRKSIVNEYKVAASAYYIA
jgi:Flp pilus assembly protein TadD